MGITAGILPITVYVQYTCGTCRCGREPYLWNVLDEGDGQLDVGEAVEVVQPADLGSHGQEETHEGKDPAEHQQQPGRPRHPLAPPLGGQGELGMRGRWW